MLHLGIDVGTQGTKCVVWDGATGAIVSRGVSNYGLLPSQKEGVAEQHPATWIEATKLALRQALETVPRKEEVRSIGVSGQQHGMVLLDVNGQVIRPAKLWCDTESSAEASELSKALGYALVPSFTITKLLWAKRNEPVNWDRAQHLLLPASYINYWLTGRMAMEAGDASGTGLLDIALKCWDCSTADIVDDKVMAMLPDLIEPDQAVGTLKPEVAHDLGLHPGVVVSGGSGDNACSALGVGVTRPGQLVVSLGTSGTLFGMSATPVHDVSGIVAPFCDATGAWLPLICLLNCTTVLQEVCEMTGRGHEELTELAARTVPPGCHGVTFLPYLAGERTPNWPNATGTISGLRTGIMTPGLLYRAALEGTALAMLAGFRTMQALGMSEARDISLVGGGARNTLWRQIFADVFQLPVRVPAEGETAALGAALQGAACWSRVPVETFVSRHPQRVSEVVQPDPGTKRVYEQAIARHQALGQLLFSGRGSRGVGVATASAEVQE